MKINTKIVSLKQDHILQKHLLFKEFSSGIIVAQIDTPLVIATISLYGEQVVDWWPKASASTGYMGLEAGNFYAWQGDSR